MLEVSSLWDYGTPTKESYRYRIDLAKETGSLCVEGGRSGGLGYVLWDPR